MRAFGKKGRTARRYAEPSNENERERFEWHTIRIRLFAVDAAVPDALSGVFPDHHSRVYPLDVG